MMGVKMVFPGPHLHPDDLLDLMQVEPPTLALGVPTIWLTLIQTDERALAEQPGRWTLPPGMRSLVGGAAVPESLIRAFARHGIGILQGWGMTETSPVCTFSYPTIKSGGEWISSVDVENALMAHPAVAEAAVIVVPDETWGERPMACVVFKPGQSADALREHLLPHGFAKWQLPDRIEVVDAIPHTSTGKFYKLELRRRFPR